MSVKMQVKFIKHDHAQKWDRLKKEFIQDDDHFSLLLVSETFGFLNNIKIKKTFFEKLNLQPQTFIEAEFNSYPKKLYNQSKKNGKYYETVAFVPSEIISVAPITISTAEPSTMD
jgi:hypothetical protein